MTDRELLDRKGHEVNDDLPPLPEPKYIYHRSDTPGEDDLFEFAEYGAVDTDSEGRVCQGCERLYTADQLRAAVLAERERNEWKRAMDQELVSLHLGTTDTPGYDTPKGALDEIIKWHTTIALDPAVSSDASALIAAERERCAKVCEAKYAPADDGWLTGYAVCAKDCAAAIRGVKT